VSEEKMESLLNLLQMNKLWHVTAYKRGDNIDEFLNSFEQQCKMVKVEEKNKASLLINSLDVDVQYELFSFIDYKDNAEDYGWVSKTLKTIFGVKRTKITPLANLLQVKQQCGQSTRDFLSQIRIQAYRIFGDVDPQSREKAMVTAFLNGLQNQSVAKAASVEEFTTVDDCFRAVKKDTGSHAPTAEGDFCMVQKAENAGLLQELVSTVAVLKSQVSYLITVINKGHVNNQRTFNNAVNNKAVNNNAANNNVRNKFLRQSDKITCFNCNAKGHYASNCTNTPFCINCNKAGHTLRTCKLRNQTVNQIEGERYLDNASLNEDYDDCEINEDNNRVCMLKIDKPKSAPQNAFVNKITVPKVYNTNSTFTSVAKEKKPVKVYSNEVEQWSNYIDGKGKKPKHTYVDVVKTNKPIITATVENKQRNVFLDTGAELNVISSDVAFNIIRNNNHVRYNKVSRNLKCANGTIMSSLGKVELNVSVVPGHSEKMIFDIVSKINPQILIGIRQLKKSGININASKNVAVVNGLEIPFKSRIYCPTTFSGNEVSQLLKRA